MLALSALLAQALVQTPLTSWCAPDGDVVVVELAQTPQPLWADVDVQLGAGLRAQGYALCEQRAAAKDEASTLNLRASGEPTAISIAISGANPAASGAPLARTFDATTFPEDSRPLAIAISAEELLRAARNQPRAARAVEAPSPPAAPPPDGRLSAGALMRMDAFTEGHLQYGPGVHAWYWFTPRWGAHVAGGFQWSPGVTTGAGEFRARTWSVATGPSFTLVPPASAHGLQVDAGVALLGVTYQGPFEPGATPALAIVPYGGAGGWLDLGTAVRLIGQLRVGWAAQRVRIFDGDDLAPSIGALHLGAAIGVALQP